MSMARLTRIAGGLAAVLIAGMNASALSAAPRAQTTSAGEPAPLATLERGDRGAGREDVQREDPASTGHGASALADDGGLPEPASWVLMLIGVAMIGGALRGFVLTNRNLARLQPEEFE
jgi:hypothetical protein